MRLAICILLLLLPFTARTDGCDEAYRSCLDYAKKDPCPKREHRLCGLRRDVCHAPLGSDRRQAAEARLSEYEKTTDCTLKRHMP